MNTLEPLAPRTRVVSFALLVLLALALPACESCVRQIIPDPPQDSAPPAYDIGLVPAELRRTLRWPTRPRSIDQIALPSSALNGPWTRGGVRLEIHQQIDQLVIDADDVEVAGRDGVFVGSIVIVPGHRRIRIHGGEYGQIVLDPPTRLVGPPWRAEDMTEDVLIEHVKVRAIESGLSGVLLRGHRIALVNSRVDAQFHAVFLGDTAPVQSQDVVVAGCSLFAAGEEPTVVLSDVARAVVVDTWMENPVLSGLRVHGESEWVFARSNTLVGGGVMIGTDPRDDIAHAWFLANTIHHSTPLLVSLEPDRIRELVLSANRIYSDSVTCAWCGRTPESWVVSANRIRPYRSSPARP